jgi:hypothetical protein
VILVAPVQATPGPTLNPTVTVRLPTVGVVVDGIESGPQPVTVNIRVMIEIARIIEIFLSTRTTTNALPDNAQ